MRFKCELVRKFISLGFEGEENELDDEILEET